MNEFKICNKCNSFDFDLLAAKLRKIDPNAKINIGCQSMCAIGSKKVFVIVNGIPIIGNEIDEVIEKVKDII